MHLALLRPETEIVCVDSMTVYRHMDIGTAKPGPDQRARVQHHLLDLVDPHEEFTVSDFQTEATTSFQEIEKRGHRALLVAGTGLYLRAVVDELDLPGRFPDVARMLEEEAARPGGLSGLHSKLTALDPEAAARIEPGNGRRVVRALEVTIGAGRPFSSYGPGLRCYPPTQFSLVGVRLDPAVQDERIERRLESMLEAGLLDEVRGLASRAEGISRTARQALAYRELLSHLENGTSYDEAVSEALRRTKAFSRRQWAWFRRDPRIRWLDPEGDPLSELLELWDTGSMEGVGD